MKTWNDYKNHVKSSAPSGKQTMEEIEELSAIISSVARIESCKATPKLDTLLKLLQPLGLTLKVIPIK